MKDIFLSIPYSCSTTNNLPAKMAQSRGGDTREKLKIFFCDSQFSSTKCAVTAIYSTVVDEDRKSDVRQNLLEIDSKEYFDTFLFSLIYP